jgi:acyl carrier protein
MAGLDPEEVTKKLKDLILSEFLPGEDPEQLTDTTPLITGGVIDSIAVLKLVSILEEQYRIEFAPHEVDAEHFDTIGKIADLIVAKAI